MRELTLLTAPLIVAAYPWPDEGTLCDVGGGVGTTYDHPGVFQLSMGTKSGTTAAGLDASCSATSATEDPRTSRISRAARCRGARY